MRLRRAALLTMATVLVAGACSKKQPPATPAPPPPAPRETPPPVRTADPDSARRAEEARLARERAELMATLQEMVFFDYDDSRIRQDAQAILSRKIPILRANPAVTLRIVGHADERGSLEYNLALGMRRARSVRDYLVNFGIDASRLTTDSMGEERPLDPGHDEAAWARNRRAEINVTGGAGNLVRGQ
jgi:peptidoglycan-associated lipoprotein